MPQTQRFAAFFHAVAEAGVPSDVSALKAGNLLTGSLVVSTSPDKARRWLRSANASVGCRYSGLKLRAYVRAATTMNRYTHARQDATRKGISAIDQAYLM